MGGAEVVKVVEVAVNALVVMIKSAVAATTSCDRCYSIETPGVKLRHRPTRSERNVCIDSSSKRSATGEFRSHSSSQEIRMPNRNMGINMFVES